GSPKALEPALRAAERASAQGAWDVAERCWRIAQRHATDDATRRRAEEGLAGALAQRGERGPAAEALRRALSLVRGDAVEEARLSAKLGELEPDPAKTLEMLERALALVRQPLRPWRALAGRSRGLSAAERVTAQVLHTLAEAHRRAGQWEAAGKARAESLALLEKGPPSPDLALALCGAAED